MVVHMMPLLHSLLLVASSLSIDMHHHQNSVHSRLERMLLQTVCSSTRTRQARIPYSTPASTEVPGLRPTTAADCQYVIGGTLAQVRS